jgi:hypothetical protein
MTMLNSELRRLVRMPLQAFGQETASATPEEAFVPAHVVLRAKPIAVSRLRVFFSPAHDIEHVLRLTLDATPETQRGPLPEPSDWQGREFRRMLRNWTPRSHVDLAVHPANLEFLPADEEIAVVGWSPGAKPDNAVCLTMLASPLPRETVSRVIAALVSHLALAELHDVARHRQQKRLSRNALPASGPQPAAPAGRLLAAMRRPLRGRSLRPALHRVLPARRNLRLCP